MPRYSLRTLLIVVTLVGAFLGLRGCIKGNLGTVHLPSDAHAGKPANVELVLAMIGPWIGGGRSHVGKVECHYRISPSEQFERQAMSYMGNEHGNLRYKATVAIPHGTAGEVLEYYFHYEVARDVFERGSDPRPIAENEKATPYRIPIEE